VRGRRGRRRARRGALEEEEHRCCWEGVFEREEREREDDDEKSDVERARRVARVDAGSGGTAAASPQKGRSPLRQLNIKLIITTTTRPGT
jgi:hypothetical protein